MVRNRSAPSGTLVPVLIYDDVAVMLDWLRDAFGFEERLRAPGRDGHISHAQMTVGGEALMLGRQGGEYRAPDDGGVSQYVHVRVSDIDGHCARAERHGAQILHPPHDAPFGERQYVARDPGGHRWTFSESVADVAPEEWGARLTGGS